MKRLMIAMLAMMFLASSESTHSHDHVAAPGNSFPPEYATLLMIHKILGIAVLITAVLSSLILEARTRKGAMPFIWTYRILLFACAICVALAGHFGGLIVYGLNHFKL